MNIRIVLIIIQALLFTCCSSENSYHLRNPNEIKSDILIILNRSNTFGLGPKYDIWITADGTVMYEGYANVKKIGFYKSHINVQKVLDLVYEFQQSGILTLQNPYDPKDCSEIPVTDAGNVTFSIRLHGNTNQFRHYLGCTGFQYEKDFFKLEDLIDQATESYKWVGTRNTKENDSN